MSLRHCPMCERDLPPSDFYKDKRGKDGLTRRCKTCHSSASYESRKKKIPTDRHERYEYHRRLMLRKEYGITLEEYDAMLESQGGVCKICSAPPEIDSSSPLFRVLHVDHCHATGAVRGLLCSSCNTGLGKFRDDAALLRLAVEYLEGAPCPVP